MSIKIGFAVTEVENEKNPEATYTGQSLQSTPHKSVVQVYFPERDRSFAYYNELFDLHIGDIVYVDGKLEGILGRVTEVNYNFKIRISDYKHVIAVVDTTVNGQFFMAGSHFVTFDRTALPPEKIITWFRVPSSDDEFVTGNDDSFFLLNDLKEMSVSASVAESDHEYYLENKVRYISLDGSRGYAIVEGSEAYEVEFEYRNGEIHALVCSCFCSSACKHQFSAMLQLRETLDLIKDQYSEEYERTGCFAAVTKATLFTFAIDGKKNGSFTL